MAAVVEAVLLAPQIAQIFGAKDGSGLVKTVGGLVTSFDFSKINVSDVTKDDYLHSGLAPSFGELNKESIKGLDEQLKVMIAGTNRELEKLAPAERSWDKILSVFMQNPLMEPIETDGANIARSDKIIKKDTTWFQSNATRRETVNEVHSWFISLIGDDDVVQSTMIDIDVLGNIVATTGAAVTSFETLFAKHEVHEKNVVDIGVLRYPDIDNPFFKLYRIELKAWSDATRILFHTEDANGITGIYNCRKFKPRDSVIDGMKKESKAKAIEEADDLFA